MMLIWIYSIWIVFALISGLLEAYYFSAVYNKVINKASYVHEKFTLVRGLVAVCILYLFTGITWQVLFIGASLMVIFPFFHDGVYYMTRNKLDGVYPLGFRDHSTTSDAKFNFDYNQRWWLVWFGFLLFIIQFAI